jgi:hypothetical protein
LIVYGATLLAFGAIFFSQPGAIELAKKEAAQAAVAQVPPGEGLYVSIRNFLPIDVPVGSGWIPASRNVPIKLSVGKHSFELDGLHPDWYATLLRVAGTILTGLGLGAVTGLLRRIAP